jgi:hypothetical protein
VRISSSPSYVVPGRSVSLSAVLTGPGWEPSDGVRYDWGCSPVNYDNTTNECGLSMSQGAFNLVPAGALPPGAYIFRVTVSRGSVMTRHAEATVTIAAPPARGFISVACHAQACDFPYRPINPTQPLHLKVTSVFTRTLI